MQVVGSDGGDALLAVDRLADGDHFIHRGRHFHAGLVDQVRTGGAEDHGAGFRTEPVGAAFRIAQRYLSAGNEIRRVPVRRRGVGVVQELVEVRQPSGADPTAGVDEGDVDDVERAALGGQFEVGALVVDGEGLDIDEGLDAGLRLELGQQVLEILVIGDGEDRDADGRARVARFGLSDDRGGTQRACSQRSARRTQEGTAAQPRCCHDVFLRFRLSHPSCSRPS